MSCLITMSQKELHRLELIQKIRDERLSVVQAAERLDLSRSQVHRLLQAYDRDGPAGLVPGSDRVRATGATARSFAMRRWIWFANAILISVRRWRARS
ncbi:helix-turn-helix domain-containing protein [Rhizobium grahamii]|uniref:helix-turn-helix domain-containing protein n=1 Tax=Rhizobium grahamii TaxID=1120045 RepID=UPI0026AD9B38